MRLFQWLLNRTPNLSDPPPRFPPNAPASSIPEDDDHDLVEQVDHFADFLDWQIGEPAVPDRNYSCRKRERQHAFDVFTIIDYSDAQGARSRRRITIRNIVQSASGYRLSCYCHERKGPRSFRCDRIECFIDVDGVVTSPQSFFRDVLGISIDSATVQGNLTQTHVDVALAALEPLLNVLIAAARSDDHLHHDELGRIMKIAEDELFRLSEDGHLGCNVTLEVLDQFNRLLPHIRPTKRTVAYSVRRLFDIPGMTSEKLAGMLESVVVADGVFRSGEASFLIDLEDMRSNLLRTD